MPKLTGEMILTWLRGNLSSFKVRKNGTEVVMPNPWGDSGAHFNISLIEKEIGSGTGKRKGFWVHDWRPGHQEHDGSFIRFVQEYKGISFFEAIKEICGSNINPRQWLRRTEAQEEAQEIDEPEEAIVQLPDGARSFRDQSDTKAYEIALNYLKSREIQLEEAKQHFIHYDSTSIIFPYIEFGTIVYWMRRSLIGKEFLYPSESKTQFIYGFDQVEPGGPLVAVESIIDSINIGPGAIAYGGANLDVKQVKKIRMLNPGYVVLAGDNDKPDRHGIRPGIEAIWVNYEMVRPYFVTYFVIPPDPHKDWNDLKAVGVDPLHYIEKHKKLATPTSLISLRNPK